MSIQIFLRPPFSLLLFCILGLILVSLLTIPSRPERDELTRLGKIELLKWRTRRGYTYLAIELIFVAIWVVLRLGTWLRLGI